MRTSKELLEELFRLRDEVMTTTVRRAGDALAADGGFDRYAAIIKGGMEAIESTHDAMAALTEHMSEDATQEVWRRMDRGIDHA